MKKGNRSSLKKTRYWRGGEGVYVLYSMVVTSPTCQVERSPLKAPAPANTVHSNKEKSKDKYWVGKKRGENCSKIESVAARKKKGNRNS